MRCATAIVENDAAWRSVLAQAVRETHDLAVAGEAADLRQALHLLKATRPEVLLVDLQLPDGGALEVIRFAVAARPACEIMVLSAVADQRNLLASLAAGASGYLLKDTPPAEIVNHIRVLRAGGSPLSPAIARRLLTHFRTPPGPADAPAPSGLSEQEKSVLHLSAKGCTYEEIARLLTLSTHTVGTYVKRIYRKLQVHSKTEAVYEARKLRWLDD